jgi:hypothetical protein
MRATARRAFWIGPGAGRFIRLTRRTIPPTTRVRPARPMTATGRPRRKMGSNACRTGLSGSGTSWRRLPLVVLNLSARCSRRLSRALLPTKWLGSESLGSIGNPPREVCAMHNCLSFVPRGELATDQSSPVQHPCQPRKKSDVASAAPTPTNQHTLLNSVAATSDYGRCASRTHAAPNRAGATPRLDTSQNSEQKLQESGKPEHPNTREPERWFRTSSPRSWNFFLHRFS